MASVVDWLSNRLRRWLLARVTPEGDSAINPPAAIVSPTLSQDAITAAYLACARALLLRGKHAEAVACLLDALRSDADGVKSQADSLTGVGADLVAACLQACVTGMEVNASSPDLHKISVVVCSPDEDRFAAVCAEYRQALAGGAFEIIRIADARSLAEGYNRGLAQAAGDIVIFSHDDIRLLSPAFRAELTAALQEFDIVGVAGATRLAGPKWTSSPPEQRRQLVCYPPLVAGPGFVCAIDGPLASRWHGDIQCLDGLFLAARRAAIADLPFDETRYDGFHFYDLDFTYRAQLAGLRLGVCPHLWVLHASKGSYHDPAWRRYAEIFCEQYDLPLTYLPPPGGKEFSTEEELREFLSALFAWQRAQPSVAGLKDGGGPVDETVLLHVGCGPLTKADAGPGFLADNWREIRLDADPAVKPDMTGSITDLSAVPSASVDAVFSSHTLEHLYFHEVPVALAEIRRVLKPNGFTVAWVPDLQAAARWIAEDKLFDVVGTTPFGPLTPFDMVFSHRGLVGRDKPYMAHHCGFTLSALVAAHRQAGFGAVIAKPRIAGFDLQVLAMPAVVPGSLLQAMAAVYFQE